MLLLPGCSEEDRSGIEQEALDTLNAAMENIEIMGSCRSETTIAVAEEYDFMDVRLRVPSSLMMEQEWTDDSLRMRVIQGVSGYALELLGYIIDDRAYFIDKEGNWKYTDYDPIGGSINGNGGFHLPQGIELAVVSADEIDVLWEDDLAIAYRLRIGDRYYRALLDELDAGISAKDSSGYEELIRRYEGMIDKAQVDMVLTIDKRSKTFFSITSTMDVKDFPFEEGVRLSLVLEISTHYKDYGKEFDIELPDEAKDAAYVPWDR